MGNPPLKHREHPGLAHDEGRARGPGARRAPMMSDRQRGMSLRPLVTMLVVGCVAAYFVWPPAISMDTALGAVTVGAFLRMLGAGLLVLMAIYVGVYYAKADRRIAEEKARRKYLWKTLGPAAGVFPDDDSEPPPDWRPPGG